MWWLGRTYHPQQDAMEGNVPSNPPQLRLAKGPGQQRDVLARDLQLARHERVRHRVVRGLALVELLLRESFIMEPVVRLPLIFLACANMNRLANVVAED